MIIPHKTTFLKYHMHHYRGITSYIRGVKNTCSNVCGISGPKFGISAINVMLPLQQNYIKAANR
jgi:hypothetical protein